MSTLRSVLLLAAALSLTGCAFGRKVDYSAVDPALHISSDKSVSVVVRDERPYVLSGGKNATFVGVTRGGYYNPFNMNTVSGLPLATDIQRSVLSALAKSNIRAQAQPSYAPGMQAGDSQQRLLVLNIREWKTDTFAKTRFDYDLTASVIDEHGKVLGSQSAKNSGPIANFQDAGRLALTQVLATPQISDALNLQSVATPSPAGANASAYDACMARVLKIKDDSLRLQAMPSCEAAQ